MKRISRCLIAMLVVVVTGYVCQPLFAGDGKGSGLCSLCGAGDGCTVCRLVCEKDEQEVTCWSCECEDFCIPCHSKRGCKHVEIACGGDGKCGDGKCGDGKNGKGDGLLSCPKRVVWFDWTPTTAKVMKRKKLLKKTHTVTIPTYKWVIENVCDKCDASDKSLKPADILPGTEDMVPEPPEVEAKLRYGNPHNLPVSFEQAQQSRQSGVAHVFAGLLK
jgi:hypothetical protein